MGSKLCYELYLTDMDMDYSKLELCGFKLSYETPCFTSIFATSAVKNDERKINAAWDYLYSEWLQNSMFEYTDEPYYEEYIIKNGKPVKLKLYLPIRKRCADTKISLIGNPGLRFIVSQASGIFAEKIASQTVIDYLTAHYPYIVKASKEFYLRKESDSYICGIRAKSELRITVDDNIESVATDHNDYLVLESSVTGEYDRYAGMLLTFARDNGINAIKQGIFAVYDARESFDNPKIKMYCPIKPKV